ncbi:MAG: pitrilysin family protein [Planctomycetales bacterium]|nr:pitrilysin family protein [Planctomycetales bacterium]
MKMGSMVLRVAAVVSMLSTFRPLLAAEGEPALIRSVEGISEYHLDNGMKVLLFPDKSSPKVTVNLTVFVGSRHEGYGEAGMAHLLEHMVFKGTPTHQNIPRSLQERGAEFNGTTWLDRTNYYETLPASDENLEFALKLEADRLVNSFISADDLAKEFSVVRSEFERGENSPQRVLMQRVTAAAFEWHNYGQSTIGNRADIEKVPADNLRRFYQKYYQPDNVILVIAGKFDEKKSLEFVKNYFGVIPRPERKLEPTYTEEPAQDGERMVTLRRVGDVALAATLYHIPSGGHPDFAAVDVLSTIMTSEPAGRLYESLVKRRVAASVFGMTFALHDPGILMFMAEATQGTDGTALVQSLIESGEGTAEKAFTPEEVERARSELLKQRELTVADSQRVAIELSDWSAQGDWRLFFLYRDRLEKVTAEDVTRVAATYLVRNNRTAGVYEPTKEAQRATIPATPDLAEMIGDYKGRSDVAQGEEFDVDPLAIEKRLARSTLSSGIKVTLLPKKTRGSIVNLRLNFRYGNAEALKGLAVAAELMPQMLNRGSEHMTRQQITDELNNYRAQLRVSGTPGVLSLSVQTSRENVAKVLEIVKEVMKHPLFPKEELEIIREEQIAQINQQMSDPIALAMTNVSRKISPYPVDDPRYVPTMDEEAERVKAVTVEQIKDVYSHMLSSAVGELTIVGDFDPELVLPSVDEFTMGWSSDVKFERLARVSVNNEKGDREQILTPDKPNAAYIAAMTIPMRDDHPDYAALSIGNFVLGSSGLSSRLGDRLRQKEGLSYSVQSSLQPSAVDERTTFFLFAISNPDNAPKVHEAIQDELKKLLDNGITAEELEAAKAGYLQEQQVQRTEDRAIVQTLESYAFIGRDMKFVAEFEDRISKLTVEEVNAALKKHIDPQRLFIVQAGDFKAEEQK